MANGDNVIRPDKFQGPSSSGGGDDGVNALMKDYVDARDDAVESRLSAKLEKLPGKGTLWGGVASIVGAIFTALVIGIALLAFGGERFDAGMASSPMVEAVVKNQAVVDQRQDNRMSAMDKKLDIIIHQTAKR